MSPQFPHPCPSARLFASALCGPIPQNAELPGATKATVSTPPQRTCQDQVLNSPVTGWLLPHGKDRPLDLSLRYLTPSPCQSRNVPIFPPEATQAGIQEPRRGGSMTARGGCRVSRSEPSATPGVQAVESPNPEGVALDGDGQLGSFGRPLGSPLRGFSIRMVSTTQGCALFAGAHEAPPWASLRHPFGVFGFVPVELPKVSPQFPHPCPSARSFACRALRSDPSKRRAPRRNKSDRIHPASKNLSRSSS